MLSLEKLTKDLSFENIDEVIGGSDSSSSSSCSSSSSSSSAGGCGGEARLGTAGPLIERR